MLIRNVLSNSFANKIGQNYGKQLTNHSKRYLSLMEIQNRQNVLFNQEQKRQKESVGRIEKIEVRYLGLPNDVTLVMNKNISTPYNCAQHLSETHCKRSALALIDSNTPWDMHRPLTDSCTLQLLNFTIHDPSIVNRAFWRTCSFLLGAALTNAFKDQANLNLHSFPSPNFRSGSFVYDFTISQKDWSPKKRELRAFAAEMIKLANNDLQIERLDVGHDIALALFENHPFKREQLPSISHRSNGIVTLYRVGNHIDISRGPMVGSTRLLGRCCVAAFHPIPCPEMEDIYMYRAQGVALPLGLNLNYFAWNILEESAKKINNARLPNEYYNDEPFEHEVVAT